MNGMHTTLAFITLLAAGQSARPVVGPCWGVQPDRLEARVEIA